VNPETVTHSTVLPHDRYLLVAVETGHVVEVCGAPVITQTDKYPEQRGVTYTAPATSVRVHVDARAVEGLHYTFWAPNEALSEAIGVLVAEVEGRG
jgi:hypothetical protein